ncbi:hypothetical protein [Streptomyces noursei]
MTMLPKVLFTEPRDVYDLYPEAAEAIEAAAEKIRLTHLRGNDVARLLVGADEDARRAARLLMPGTAVDDARFDVIFPVLRLMVEAIAHADLAQASASSGRWRECPVTLWRLPRRRRRERCRA